MSNSTSVKPTKQNFTANEWKTIIVAGAICFLNVSGQGLIGPIMPMLIQELNLSRAVIGLSITVATILSAVLGVMAGKIMQKITIRNTILIASIAAAVYGFGLASASNAITLYIVQICMAVLGTFGTYAVTSALLSQLLGSRMKTVFGIVAGVSNLGTALLTVILGQTIPVYGYKAVVTITGLVIGITGVVLNLLFLGNTKTTKSDATAVKKEKVVSDEPGLTMKEATKTASFWLFGAGMFLSAMLFTGVGLFAIDFMTGVGAEYSYATSIMASVTVMGAVVTMSSGFITEKLGARGLLTMMFGGFTIGTLIFTYLFPKSLSFVIAMIAMAFIACVRSTNTTPGLIIPEMFGRKDFGSLSSVGMSFYGLGAGLASILVGLLYDATNSYVAAFTTLAVLSILALVLFMMALKASPMKKIEGE